jgi:hypothetical protein
MKKVIVFSVILLVTLTAFGQYEYSGIRFEQPKHLTQFTYLAKDPVVIKNRLNNVVKFFYTDSISSRLKKEAYAFVANDKLYTISYGDKKRITNLINRNNNTYTESTEWDVFLMCWNGTAWEKATREKIQTDTHTFDNSIDAWLTESYYSVQVGNPFKEPVSDFVQKLDNGDVIVYLVCMTYNSNDIYSKYYYKKITLIPNSDGTYRFTWDGVKTPID